MKKNILKFAPIGLLILIPAISFAALSGVTDFLTSILGILNLLIKVVFALAIVYFFWGMVQFILHAGDTKTRDEGKQKMLWGIIALFVMASLFGILSLIGDSVGIPFNSTTPTDIPNMNPYSPAIQLNG